MTPEERRLNAPAPEEPHHNRIPAWHGFNLQAMIAPPGGGFAEADFALMAEWGFNFARLPLSYWTWSSRDDWFRIDEKALEEIDRAVEYGRQYGIHVNLNFHRLPGYCVNGREQEPADLFAAAAEERRGALAAAVFYWRHFARRYKGIPDSRLSFDLINEPPLGLPEEPCAEVVRALVAGIREIDPERLIFADGLDLGQEIRLPVYRGLPAMPGGPMVERNRTPANAGISSPKRGGSMPLIPGAST